MEDKKKEKKIPNGKKKVKEVKPSKKEVNKKHDEENAALNEKILRLSAEMQNIKRRGEEEIQRLCKYDGEKLILSLLPIIDNFERAIKLDDNDLTDELSKFLSGFKMIYTNLLSILDSYEVKAIDAYGKAFDPNYMEAVLTDKDDKQESNIVLEVLQKGYTYKDKVIRPAMVKVNE